MCPPDIVTVVWSLFDGVGVVPSAADAEKNAVQCADSLKAADAQRVAKEASQGDREGQPPSIKKGSCSCLWDPDTHLGGRVHDFRRRGPGQAEQ